MRIKNRIWLRKLRESKNLTQESVATQANISRTMLTEIENGKANPSVATAKRIADTLGFDWTMFFESEEGGVISGP